MTMDIGVPPHVLSESIPWGERIRQGIGRHVNMRRFMVIVPYLWLLLFFLIPFLIVMKISFAEPLRARPPYSPLFEWGEDAILNIRLTFANYLFLWQDRLYIDAYLNSLWVALVSTVLCLLMGYPMAYAIAQADTRWRMPLLMLIILPFWTSFLIRVYAWIGIFQDQGLLNHFLLWLGVIDVPLRILNTNTAVYIGIVYSYLPFMILPLYATLERMDTALLEAAKDLGAKPWRAFLSITLPLSFPGIIAGALLVFIPVVGEFVIPALLGGTNTFMIGREVWALFFEASDWPTASALTVFLLLFLVAPIMLFQYFQGRAQEAQKT